MHRSIALSLVAGLFPLAMIGAPAHAAPVATGPSVTVIGGTLTARFTDDSGGRSQGWWSIAAERVGATSVKTSAERQSSISSRGVKCQGTTYAERLRYLKRVDIVIVEAGTEDHRVCTSNGKRTTLSRSKQKAAIADFARALGKRVDKLKIPRSHVFFVTPQVPVGGKTSANLRKDIRKYAGPQHERFRVISTSRLSRSQTARGEAPNHIGNTKLGKQVAKAIRPVAKKARTKARAPGRGPSIMVYGDSITSFFTADKGSPSEGWWSIAGRRLKASSIRLSAEGGSGINSRGNRCDGTTFGERLQHLQRVDILIIEVGRNDYKQCVTRRKGRYIDAAAQRAGINHFMNALSARVKQLGIDPRRVYLVTPWGSRDADRAAAIQWYIKSAAQAPGVGFTYIQTRRMRDSYTLDRVHPNQRGNRWLADIVTRAVRA